MSGFVVRPAVGDDIRFDDEDGAVHWRVKDGHLYVWRSMPMTDVIPLGPERIAAFAPGGWLTVLTEPQQQIES